MPKNYYLILGISSNSESAEIKEAYRRLAKEFHPDYFGKDNSIFLSIHEAYSVLIDPDQRREYDRKMEESRLKRNVGQHVGMEAEIKVEPLVPDPDMAEPVDQGLYNPPLTFRPSVHSLVNRWLGGFSDSWSCPETDARQLEIHVRLTRRQAHQGGHVRITVPLNLRCPECRGSGRSGSWYECWRCSGEGGLHGEYPLLLSYPAGVANNHSVRIPLDRFGDNRRYIRVRFLIEHGNELWE